MVAKEVYHVYEYLLKLRSRAANKFNLPLEKINVGQTIIQALDENPESICQIDGDTGKKQTNGYVSQRVKELAKSFHEAGLNPGDVIIINAPNGLETCVPVYAALLCGLPFVPLDSMSTCEEINHFVNIVNPKAIFCCKANVDRVKSCIEYNETKCHLIVLDDPENNVKIFTDKFIRKGDIYYREFDLSTPALLICTSGTTGKPKVAILTNQNILCSFPYNFLFFNNFPLSNETFFLISSIQWISAVYLYIGSAICGFTRLQTSLKLTTSVFSQIFETFKPSNLLINTAKLFDVFDHCDMSCLHLLLIGGSALNKELEIKFRNRYPNVKYTKGYGMTELFQLIFAPTSVGPLVAIGKPYTDRFKYRIVNTETGMILTKPHEIGELHVKDECKFVGYYNNEIETKKLFTEDGYLKTGDLVYRDEDNYHYVVDRLKMVLKHKGFQVYPQEIEDVLRRHNGVAQAVVTSIPGEAGDIPTALVVKASDVKAKELIDLVASSLSDYKRLEGGIVFVDELPLTVTHKVNRSKAKEIAAKGKREY